MKTIMWIQSPGKGTDDYYFIDGELATNGKTKIEAEKLLSSSEKAASILMRRKDSLRAQLNSPNFVLSYIPTRGCIYKSIFNELAEDGRRASFVALFELTSPDEIWRTLSNNAASVGRSLRLIEKKKLEEYIKNKRTAEIFILCSTLIVFLIILLICIN